MSARNTGTAKARRRHDRMAKDNAREIAERNAMQARARQDQLCDLGATFMIVQGLMVAGPLGPLVPRWQP